jgi:hypothetical protein
VAAVVLSSKKDPRAWLGICTQPHTTRGSRLSIPKLSATRGNL